MIVTIHFDIHKTYIVLQSMWNNTVNTRATWIHEERLGNIFRELWKTGSHPGLNQGPLTLAVSALPPELWPPGDSQPSQFSISLHMCRQNPARDWSVTPLHKGRSHTEWNILYIHSSAHEAGSPSREPPNTTHKLRYMWGKAWEYTRKIVWEGY